jgi:hypothetical protein
MTANQTGSSQLNLQVNGVVVDQVYVEYLAGGIGTDDYQFNDFILSPNPAKDQVRIELIQSSGEVQVEITDLNGKVIINKTLEQDLILNTEGLSSGIYLIRVRTNDKWLEPKRLIIQM